MKLSWIAIFLLVFFLINVVRFVMAYFGKKLSGVPEVPGLVGSGVDSISKSKIGQALMDVVEKKLFPDVANLYDGIRTQAQLDELVEKVTGALEGVVANATGSGDKVEELDAAEVQELLASTEGKVGGNNSEGDVVDVAAQQEEDVRQDKKNV